LSRCRESTKHTCVDAGIYTHQGLEQSRRDDLESILYILIYLSNGALPWMHLKVSDKRKKYEMIAMRKINIVPRDLCQNLPKQYLDMYNYVRSLKFDEKPDYLYLRAQIRSAFVKRRYQYDYVYDWYCVAQRMKTLLDREV
jgi:hypothetical protein